MRHTWQPQRNAGRGFTLLEVVFALMVFAGIALVFAAVFPAALGAARMNGYYAEAAALAQHKLEQVRAAGFGTVQSPAALAARGVLDPGAAGAGLPYTAAFTQVDLLSGGAGGAGVFPPGTTGTITVRDYAAVNTSVPAGTVDAVTVTLQWPNRGATETYTASSLVIQMPHS